jgi:hypothetical protein
MIDPSDTASGAVGQRPDQAARWRDRLALAWLLCLGACAQQPATTPAAEVASMQQRVQLLEQRVQVLERYIWNLPSPPLRNRDEIEKNIQSLEARRSALLQRYTDSHPEVREVDLSLRLLKLQLEMMDQAKKTAK